MARVAVAYETLHAQWRFGLEEYCMRSQRYSEAYELGPFLTAS